MWLPAGGKKTNLLHQGNQIVAKYFLKVRWICLWLLMKKANNYDFMGVRKDEQLRYVCLPVRLSSQKK
jgi:hypothetical protein